MEEVLVVYRRVIHVASKFLESSDFLTVEVLREHDPSVEVIARNMRLLADVIDMLARDNYEDQNMAINAFQCCLVMKQIADAVSEDDQDKLDALVKQLEMHTNAP